MALNVTYYNRKAKGLCVKCGDPAIPGKTICEACRAIYRVKSKEYRDSWSAEKKEKIYAKVVAWQESHPERMAEYKKRKPEYNRRQREATYGSGYEW